MAVTEPILLGIVEGLTEFLPVSSTGHLILASALLGYDERKWALFNVVIQLGAILAVIVLYWRTFWTVARGLFARQPGAWRFLRNLVIAFLPAAVVGLAFHKRIEAMLGRPDIVAVALIVGGIAILIVERLVKRGDKVGIADVGVGTSVGIGLIQCISMIPGVSRSGATIMGALSLGVERRTAAEFSFFLAVPTMLGATALELAKNWHEIGAPGQVGLGTIALGFVVAFAVALAVIRSFVAFVSRHGFTVFAWYRIVAGALALLWLNRAI
jgi:undecaprenyl-diphosphatase